MFNAKERFVKLLIAFSTGLILLSCTTVKMYSGPDLPADQVAIIESADLSVTIESCDGKPTGYSRLAVLPGEHLIEMSFYDRVPGDWTYWSVDNAIFSFIAQAGHTYSIGWRISPSDYSTYVVVLKDRTSGVPVLYTSESGPHRLGMYNESGYPVR